MTDLELIKKCADRMEIAMVWDDGGWVYSEHYNPLCNDAQNAQLEWLLLEREGRLTFRTIGPPTMTYECPYGSVYKNVTGRVTLAGKRRFICECVAKLEK